MIRKEASVSVWKMAIVAAASGLVLAACGSTSSSGGDTSGCTAKGAGTGTAAQTVKINSDPNTVGRYDPGTVTVKVGDSVQWDWVDSSAQHSVTADDGSFDSCLQSSGGKFVVTFSKAGDVKYHCTIHSGMVGDVKVG